MAKEIITDDELIQAYGKSKNKEKKVHEAALEKLKHATNCSYTNWKKIFISVFPILAWLPKYRIKNDLPGDLVGGLTVGIVHIPQGLAYSLLAGLPPINGLYVSFFPVLMYAIFGTTRQLSIGTFAVISLMVGAVIDKNTALLTCNDLMGTVNAGATLTYSDESTVTSSTLNTSIFSTETSAPSCEKAIEYRKIEIAIGLSIAVAVIHFAMYLFRLGIVTIYFSSHMVSGYTCGAAFHVLTSQVSKLLGVDVPRKSGILSLVYTYIDVFSNLNTINWETVAVSACCILVLVLGKFINQKYKKKLPFPMPWELLLVILSTVISSFVNLSEVGVEIVGEVPQGIETSVPKSNDIGLVFLDAIPIAIVIYSVSISLSRMFSEKHGYEINSNQELLAYAVANTIGAFFQCYPSGSSLSRSIIWDETGGNSQITGLLSAALVLIVLLWIGPLFETLPQATLAAIIVVNLKRLLLQFQMLKALWVVSKLDAVTWFVSWLSVVLLGVDYGLYVGVGFSLLTVVLRIQTISGNSLVEIKGTGLYKSSKHFVGETNPNYFLFKFPAPLIYANQERFKSDLYCSLGFKPSLEIVKRQKSQRETKTKISIQSSEHHLFHEKEIESLSSFGSKQDEIRDIKLSNSTESTKCKPSTRSLCDQISTTSQNDQDLSTVVELERKFPTKVILDMSQCSFIDNDGVKTLKALYDEFLKLNIHLVLVKCAVDIRARLISGNFPAKESNGNPLFFVSLQKAISYPIDENSPLLGNGVSIKIDDERQSTSGESTWL